jgi:hypothetical protein
VYTYLLDFVSNFTLVDLGIGVGVTAMFLILSTFPSMPTLRLCAKCHMPYVGSYSYGGCMWCG